VTTRHPCVREAGSRYTTGMCRACPDCGACAPVQVARTPARRSRSPRQARPGLLGREAAPRLDRRAWPRSWFRRTRVSRPVCDLCSGTASASSNNARFPTIASRRSSELNPTARRVSGRSTAPRSAGRRDQDCGPSSLGPRPRFDPLRQTRVDQSTRRLCGTNVEFTGDSGSHQNGADRPARRHLP